MEQLSQVLLDHAKRYSLMQPVDAVKLIYQNEFGGGHLVSDVQAFWRYLKAEYAAIEKDPNMPKAIPIGNHTVRVHLNALTEAELEALGHRFLADAQHPKGEMAVFLQKLDILRQLTKDGIFCFTCNELEAYLEPYIASGCPMVSHSDVYRRNYHPAYRIIISD